jgi:hypothetical protein
MRREPLPIALRRLSVPGADSQSLIGRSIFSLHGTPSNSRIAPTSAAEGVPSEGAAALYRSSRKHEGIFDSLDSASSASRMSSANRDASRPKEGSADRAEATRRAQRAICGDTAFACIKMD